MKKKLIVAVMCLGLTFPMVGCNGQADAQKASTIISGILNVAQAEEAAVPAADAAVMTRWVSLGQQSLMPQLNACLSAAGNTQAKLATCFTAFASGLLNPTELSQLRIMSPGAQHNVQIVATAIVIAINAMQAAWGAATVPTPVITSAPTPAELRTFQDEVAQVTGIELNYGPY